MIENEILIEINLYLTKSFFFLSREKARRYSAVSISALVISRKAKQSSDPTAESALAKRITSSNNVQNVGFVRPALMWLHFTDFRLSLVMCISAKITSKVENISQVQPELLIFEARRSKLPGYVARQRLSTGPVLILGK